MDKLKIPKLVDFKTEVKPLGQKKKYIVSTSHGEITRTSERDYQAIAYSVVDGKIQGTSFSASLQGAYKTACSWRNINSYYGNLELINS